MISANELRVGNWVKCIKDDFDLFIRVSGIHVRSDKNQTDEQFYGVYEYYLELNDFDFLDSGKNFEAFVNYHRGVKSPENIEGIPLTEEILLKCGFEETYRSEFRIRYDHKDFMFIGYDINLSGIDNTATGLRYYGSHIKVEYLHDLQNAFKVFTGQELTINL